MSGSAKRFDRDGVLARLRELGVSGTGAAQILDAEPLTDAADRRLLAEIVGGALTSGPAAAMSMETADDAESGTPGTSKVSTRITAGNYD